MTKATCKTMIGDAVFSPDRRYRYSLTRNASPYASARGVLLFVMLNPSTADEVENDPTVSRCLMRALKWNYSRLIVCNIFALRSTDPTALYDATDPIGPDNDATIVTAACGAETVVCAWGEHGDLGGRGSHVRSMLTQRGIELHALRVNKGGQPAHPLYLPYSLVPIRL